MFSIQNIENVFATHRSAHEQVPAAEHAVARAVGGGHGGHRDRRVGGSSARPARLRRDARRCRSARDGAHRVAFSNFLFPLIVRGDRRGCGTAVTVGGPVAALPSPYRRHTTSSGDHRNP